MPAPMPTDTVRRQSERKASPTARGPWPRSQSETTPKTTRNGVAPNGRIPANPAARIAAATRSSGSRNRYARRRSRKPPGVTPMPEDPMDRGEYHTVGHRTNDDADGRPDRGRPPSLSRARKDGGARARAGRRLRGTLAAGSDSGGGLRRARAGLGGRNPLAQRPARRGAGKGGAVARRRCAAHLGPRP